MGQDMKSCLKKNFFSLGEQHVNQASFLSKSNRVTRVLQPANTIKLKSELSEESIASSSQEGARTTQRPMVETSLVWCGLTDMGLIRDHNEDYFSCKELEESTLFIVADGMGGHDAGEVASRLAVETACREVQDGAKGDYDPEKLVEQAVKCANAEVVREGISRGSNMGTTLTLALMTGDRAYIASVGDSRTYWIKDGSIRQVTEDHSLVAKLVSAGKLTKEESRNHPKANLLYRSIGTDENVKVDTFKVDLKRGDGLLLCTDGLWAEVADDDIRSVCSAEKDLKTACTKLIQVANENGGKDNITAVVVKLM